MNLTQNNPSLMFKHTPQSTRKINPVQLQTIPQEKSYKSKSRNKSSSKSSRKDKQNSHQKLSFQTKKMKQSTILSQCSQKVNHKRNESEKNNPCNETYSSSNQFQPQALLQFSKSNRNGSLSQHKSKLCFGGGCKKDRKFSENVQGSIQKYEQMKNCHNNEQKQAEEELNEQELRRLKKIHTVEEVQCMVNVIKGGNI